MHVGDQSVGLTTPELQFLVRHGVTHVDASLGGRDNIFHLSVDDIREAMAVAAAEGVVIEMTHLDVPRSVILAQDPERDADIARVCAVIETAGRAGLRGTPTPPHSRVSLPGPERVAWAGLNYSFSVLGGIERTDTRATGRGDSSYSTFILNEYDNAAPSAAGTVSRDECFERIGYFLSRVVPVAERWGVQLACHLDAPPYPEMRGVERWDWPVFDVRCRLPTTTT